MVDYNLTKIYYILVNGMKYYGHTTERYLSTRQRKHRVAYRSFKFTDNTRCKLMLAMKDNNYDAEDIVCVWVEDYPCDSVNKARAREQHWVMLDGDLNTNVPNRTNKESDKASRLKRSEKIKENNCKWRMINKDKIKEYNIKHKDRFDEMRRMRNANPSEEDKEKRKAINKQYNKTHRDELKEYKAKRYQANKEEIKSKRMEYYALNKEQINLQRRQARNQKKQAKLQSQEQV